MVIYTNEHLTDLLNEQYAKVRELEKINNDLLDVVDIAYLVFFTAEKSLSLEEQIEWEERAKKYLCTVDKVGI